ncbi:MAG: DNA primase [Lachnospiraceae bacterium]|nr:DNA primase [Lachnospiraceae bacterium]
MYYPDEVIEEVRLRNDIVDVISSYVRLSKKGSNYFGLCPFHSEKTGSFSVTPSKQMFYCFGCHEGGNVISFIQKYENMTFGEAVRLLADRAGMSLPESDDRAAREKENRRARLLEINKEAAKYYYSLLRRPEGRHGMDYFLQRKLTEETMQRFGLGFARPSRNELLNYLKSKGYPDEILSQSGLFNFSEKEGMTDKFWNRVMFPIMDAANRVIAFGGRVTGTGEPKYLNSPETLIFEKSRNLYGLNFAKSSKAKNIIICEGYMDVIAMHQAGFDQAVAALGTAFTSGHANLIARYARERVRQDEIARYKDVLICFDSDGPGVDAALRALSMLREAGLAAKVINMQPHKDPDEFIKALGAEEFQKRIDDAENGFMFTIRMLEAEYDMKDPTGKSRFITDVCSRLVRIEDPVERENLTGLIAYRYDVSVNSINEVTKKQALAVENVRTVPVPIPTRNTGKGINDAAKTPQSKLLSWLAEEPDIYAVVKRYISADDFADPLCRKVAQILFAQLEEGRCDPAGIFSQIDDEEEAKFVAEALHQSVGNLETVQIRETALKDLMLNIKRLSLTRSDRSDNDFDTIIKIRKEIEQLERDRIVLQ